MRAGESMAEDRYAVVGAGVAGLAAARVLAAAGLGVEVFEKSRGAGGRVATRRALGTTFDHGAQYFTVRDPAFAAAVAPLVADGRLADYRPRWGEGSPGDEPLWVGVPGMAELGRGLAALPGPRAAVHTDWTVRRIGREAGGWWLEDGEGRRAGPYAALVLAVPAPQAANLLPGGDPLLPALGAVRMQACLALMLTFSTPLATAFDVDWRPDPVLPFVARNNVKPGRPAGEAWVLHADGAWSETHADAEPEGVADRLCAALGPRLGIDLPSPSGRVLHRWRYARVIEPLGLDCLYDAGRRLLLCGDWCVGARVEAAFLSGAAAAARLLAGA
jgi:renalase